MSRIALGVLAVALFASTAHADTVIAGGNLPGASNTWTTLGSPYILQGDVTVPAGATLTIDAGVEVRAAAGSDAQGAGLDPNKVELNINGSLVVNGTVNAPVVFHSAANTTGSWYGILVNASATAATFTNARIEYARFGLTSYATGSVLATSNLTVQNAQSYGVYLRAGTGTLDALNILNAGTIGVYIGDSASPTLTNSIVRGSGSYGVQISHNTSGQTVTIDNCTLTNNTNGNVYTNAIQANAATVTVKDSILTSSGYGVYKPDYASVTVTNSNVWGNSTNYYGASPGTGCIAQNPLFVSPSDLRLTSNSPSRFGAAGGGDQGAAPYDGALTPGLYGTLWANTTLDVAHSPFTADGDLTVAPGVTLTIEAGATLQFKDGMDIMGSSYTGTLANPANNRGDFIVRGRLVADGTTNAPITIRSTTSNTGSWYGVVLDTSAHDTVIDNVTISRAQYALTYASSGANNVITNSTADTAQSYGLWLRTGSLTVDGWRSILAGTIGIYVGESASPTLVNCIVRNSGSYGVQISHNTSGQTVMIDNCTLTNNTNGNVYTNAIQANAATVTVKDSILTSSGYGIYKPDYASVSVTNSNVWGNSTNYYGASPGTGCIAQNPLFVSPSDLRLTSNSPSRFGATGGGDQGAAPYDGVATPGLYGTLWVNTTLVAANGPYTADGDLTVAPGVTLTIEPGTTLQFKDGMDIMGSSYTGTLANPANNRGDFIVRGRLIADGTTAAPITIRSTTSNTGSWYGVVLDTTAHDSVIDNVAISRAQYALTYASTGTNNVITNSTADTAQSYGLWLRTGSLTVDGWRSYTAGTIGIYVGESASPTLVNCIVRNSGSYGVQISHNTSGQTVALTNCTLTNNTNGNVYTNAIQANAATVTIKNSILTSSGYGIYKPDYASVSVTYSDVWGNSTNYYGASAGTGCISANPLFVSTSDLHLQGTSVAIDAGTTGPNHDADGIARPLDGDGIAGAQYDMGAYEFVLMAQCGNGSVEPGEFCDSGANNGMYGYCNANCTALGPRCGDGMMNGNEQCDDANGSNTDACLNTCMAATCGDGFVRAGSEQCDDGNQFNTDACTNQCMTATCGDGYVRAGTEACDDGNQSNTDACLTTCVAASCGDGYTYAGTEDCDDQNNSNTDACLNTCKAASCGDGFIRAGMEACDDGNMIATDNCTATCTVATCGDGVVHAGVEECDDANQANTDACVASCKLAACGDGYIRAGVEVCDDGNVINTDGCSNQCVSTTCGDGMVQAETEECDDGNMTETDGCRNNCADAACGDGVVRDGVEDCDDGNVMAGDGCSPACKVEGGMGSGSGSDDEPGTPDDGGGCCQTSGGVGGSWLLALVVLGAIRRRRR